MAAPLEPDLYQLTGSGLKISYASSKTYKDSALRGPASRVLFAG
jgi:hypothetical protein